MNIDNWTVERDGVTYAVELRPDEDSSPGEFTSRSEDPELFRAWELGQFVFVGVVVSVAGYEASIWSVDYAQSGEAPEDTNTRETIDRDYVPDLISDVLTQVRTDTQLTALLAAARKAEIETSTIRHTTCRLCGHDIEGDTADPSGEWRDRGNGTHCLTYESRRGFVTPPAGQQHEPIGD